MTTGSRITSLLIVLLLAATSAQGQRRWNGKEKHWYTDPLWWVGEAVIAGAFAADAHSSSYVRDRCPGCRETNPLLGPRPSNRAIAVDSSLLFGLYTAFHIGSWKACPDPDWDDKAWRVACYTAIPAIIGPLKIRAAIHNYNLAAGSGSLSTQSLSKNSLGRAQSTSDSITDTGARARSVRRYVDKPFLLPKELVDCGRSLLRPCISIQPLTDSKVDLRSVQFR
jgi:hypothetical protein